MFNSDFLLTLAAIALQSLNLHGGEGQRPWDAKPDGVMTNATVGYVTQSPEGGVVHVTYKDG